LHTTLDAIRDTRRAHPFTLDELDKIKIHGSQVTVDHVGWAYEPRGETPIPSRGMTPAPTGEADAIKKTLIAPGQPSAPASGARSCAS
jgi:hypothetical protein